LFEGILNRSIVYLVILLGDFLLEPASWPSGQLRTLPKSVDVHLSQFRYGKSSPRKYGPIDMPKDRRTLVRESVALVPWHQLRNHAGLKSVHAEIIPAKVSKNSVPFGQQLLDRDTDHEFPHVNVLRGLTLKERIRSHIKRAGHYRQRIWIGVVLMVFWHER